MTVVLEDAVTGERREWPADRPKGVSWWTEGNGSCDCNRRDLFPENEPPDVTDFLAPGESFCHGCVRYYVAAVDPMPEGYTLADFNCDYPTREGT